MKLKLARICVFGVAFALCSATAVQAQLEPEVQTGSRIPVKPKAVDPVVAGAIKKGFGLCMLRFMTDVSAAVMIHSDPVQIDWKALGTNSEKFFSQKPVERCLGEEGNGVQSALGMRFTESAFRAILMEEAYLSRFSNAPSLPEGSEDKIGRVYVSTGDDLPHAMGLGQFADCLIFHDTMHADALLRTAPGTKSELAAAQALAPILGACLVQGQTLALTPTNIRAIVADGLWTRYVGPTATSLAQVK